MPRHRSTLIFLTYTLIYTLIDTAHWHIFVYIFIHTVSPKACVILSTLCSSLQFLLLWWLSLSLSMRTRYPTGPSGTNGAVHRERGPAAMTMFPLLFARTISGSTRTNARTGCNVWTILLEVHSVGYQREYLIQKSTKAICGSILLDSGPPLFAVMVLRQYMLIKFQ